MCLPLIYNKLTTKEKNKFRKKLSLQNTKFLCDFVLNIHNKNIPISENHFISLCKHKKKIHFINKKRESFAKKRKVLQSGGFFNILVSALSAAIPIITQLIEKNKKK